MKDLEEMSEEEIITLIEDGERLLFAKNKIRRMKAMNQKIEMIQRKTFEDSKRSVDSDEFDYTHR